MNARVCILLYLLQWIIAVDDRTSMSRGKTKKHVDFVFVFAVVASATGVVPVLESLFVS